MSEHIEYQIIRRKIHKVIILPSDTPQEIAEKISEADTLSNYTGTGFDGTNYYMMFEEEEVISQHEFMDDMEMQYVPSFVEKDFTFKDGDTIEDIVAQLYEFPNHAKLKRLHSIPEYEGRVPQDKWTHHGTVVYDKNKKRSEAWRFIIPVTYEKDDDPVHLVRETIPTFDVNKKMEEVAEKLKDMDPIAPDIMNHPDNDPECEVEEHEGNPVFVKRDPDKARSDLGDAINDFKEALKTRPRPENHQQRARGEGNANIFDKAVDDLLKIEAMKTERAILSLGEDDDDEEEPELIKEDFAAHVDSQFKLPLHQKCTDHPECRKVNEVPSFGEGFILTSADLERELRDHADEINETANANEAASESANSTASDGLETNENTTGGPLHQQDNKTPLPKGVVKILNTQVVYDETKAEDDIDSVTENYREHMAEHQDGSDCHKCLYYARAFDRLGHAIDETILERLERKYGEAASE